MTKKIITYRDLLEAKQELKTEITAQEDKILNNKLVQFTSSINNGNFSLIDSLQDSLSSIGLKNILASPLGNLLGTYLLSNKYTRKYFIGFTIVKESIPYALQKLKEIINSAEKNDTHTTIAKDKE